MDIVIMDPNGSGRPPRERKPKKEKNKGGPRKNLFSRKSDSTFTTEKAPAPEAQQEEIVQPLPTPILPDQKDAAPAVEDFSITGTEVTLTQEDKSAASLKALLDTMEAHEDTTGVDEPQSSVESFSEPASEPEREAEEVSSNEPELPVQEEAVQESPVLEESDTTAESETDPVTPRGKAKKHGRRLVSKSEEKAVDTPVRQGIPVLVTLLCALVFGALSGFAGLQVSQIYLTQMISKILGG